VKFVEGGGWTWKRAPCSLVLRHPSRQDSLLDSDTCLRLAGNSRVSRFVFLAFAEVMREQGREYVIGHDINLLVPQSVMGLLFCQHIHFRTFAY
jgi:hypothetical protein